MMKPCKHCGTMFRARTHLNRYCSTGCRDESAKIQSRLSNKKAKDRAIWNDRDNEDVRMKNKFLLMPLTGAQA